MTLANLLKLANEVTNAAVLGDHVRGNALRLAAAISSLLTAETCGWERPEAVKGKVLIPVGWSSDMEPLPVSPADARVMAVMLLNAASEAEEGSK